MVEYTQHGSHVAVIQIIQECLTNGYKNSTDFIVIYTSTFKKLVMNEKK